MSDRDDGKYIRESAEQLLQRVEEREQLLSLSPGSAKQFPTPRQQEPRKQLIVHDKNEGRSAEQSLRRHGYVPKVDRRRVIDDGKVFVEEIEGESDGDDISFVSCLEEEGQIAIGADAFANHDKDEWVDLSSLNHPSAETDDGGWEPLEPARGSSQASETPMEEQQVVARHVALKDNSIQDVESSLNDTQPKTINQEMIQHNESDVKQDDNPLFWIGGGLAVVGAVAGLAFANLKKKEHYEKKTKNPRSL